MSHSSIYDMYDSGVQVNDVELEVKDILNHDVDSLVKMTNEFFKDEMCVDYNPETDEYHIDDFCISEEHFYTEDEFLDMLEEMLYQLSDDDLDAINAMLK